MKARNKVPLSGVDAQDTKTEITCSGAKMILLYLEDRYGREAVGQVVAETGMSLPYLENSSNWISLLYLYRLQDKLVNFTGNPKAAYEAGLYSGDPRSFGIATSLFARVAFFTLGRLYRFWVQSASRWDKTSQWTMLEMRADACRLSVAKLSPYCQSRNNCLAIQGSLVGAARVRGLPLSAVRITEIQCACDGHDSCVYQLAWKEYPFRTWVWVLAVVGEAVGVACGYALQWTSFGLVLALVLPVIGAGLGRGMDFKRKFETLYQQSEDQARALLEAIRSTEQINQELQSRIEIRTMELSRSNSELQQALRNLKESQERMIVAEKQSAVGVLAAGMAHEFNNPLNAVSLSVEALKEEIGADSPPRPHVEILDRAAGRCRRIVNDLLSYARESRPETHVLLQDIVEASIALFRKEHSESIRIEQTIDRDLPAACLDRMQIQQVALNLLKNASDAMSDQGEIRVSLSAEGSDMVLAVTDHGPGIPESLLQKIFDPFFTTKKMGKGLGLSITYQLVVRNGGMIDVSSPAGEGATFTVRFPVQKGHPGPSSRPTGMAPWPSTRRA